MSVQTASKEMLITEEQITVTDFFDRTEGLFSVIVLLYDFGKKKLQYNTDQVCVELGYEKETLNGPVFILTDIIHPGDLPGFLNVLERLEGRDSSIREFTCRFRAEDGQYLTYSIRTRSKIGSKYATLIAVREDGLSDEMDELKHITSETEAILQFGTFEYDIVRDTAKWSDGLYRLFGYTDERPAIDFSTFLSHIEPDAREVLKDCMRRVRTADRQYNEEYNITAQDGTVKRIQIVGKRLVNGDEPVKDIGIIRDVTLKRKQEEHLKQAIDELQRSNKELEEFAYVASHDLQEPLRKISTFCGRLSDRFSGALSDEGKLYIDRIMASAESMRVLIDNLLEFSRISRIRQPFVDLNLNFILHQVKNDLELSIEEAGTIIQAENLPVVEASLSQMKQLFNNIINNAIKFRKQGQAPRIEISSHMLSSQEKATLKIPVNKVFYSIKFCDNGIGFESEYAAKIFQIFQRLHGKSEYPGSGIGLAICKKIVDHHNGLIFAENVPDQGACFTVILPERQAL